MSVTIDQESAEELAIILKHRFPSGNVTIDSNSFRHFLRMHMLHRLIDESRREFWKHITSQEPTP